MGYQVTVMGRKGLLYWNEESECWEGDPKKATVFDSQSDAEIAADSYKVTGYGNGANVIEVIE